MKTPRHTCPFCRGIMRMVALAARVQPTRQQKERAYELAVGWRDRCVCAGLTIQPDLKTTTKD